MKSQNHTVTATSATTLSRPIQGPGVWAVVCLWCEKSKPHRHRHRHSPLALEVMTDPYAYKRDAKLQERLSREIEVIAKLPGNAVCADCDETKRLRFCSVTLGVFLCNRCYGLHRQLGAHVTRGKCLGLDAWKPEEIELLRAVGNSNAAAHYEANLPGPPWSRPTALTSDREVLSFIRDKYERKKYVCASNTAETLQPSVSVGGGGLSSVPSAAALVAAVGAAAAPPPSVPPPTAPPPTDLLGDWASFGDLGPNGNSSSSTARQHPVSATAAVLDLMSLLDSPAPHTQAAAAATPSLWLPAPTHGPVAPPLPPSRSTPCAAPTWCGGSTAGAAPAGVGAAMGAVPPSGCHAYASQMAHPGVIAAPAPAGQQMAHTGMMGPAGQQMAHTGMMGPAGQQMAHTGMMGPAGLATQATQVAAVTSTPAVPLKASKEDIMRLFN